MRITGMRNDAIVQDTNSIDPADGCEVIAKVCRKLGKSVINQEPPTPQLKKWPRMSYLPYML